MRVAFLFLKKFKYILSPLKLHHTPLYNRKTTNCHRPHAVVCKDIDG